MPEVRVTGIPTWVDRRRLLGAGDWFGDIEVLERRDAADLAARLRGLELGGQKIELDIRPPLKRSLVRSARTDDARRRRQTTPGFTLPGTRLDDEGKISLTPEILALRLGEQCRGATVIDAMCGCGGNAIGFARAGCRVIAVDSSRRRLEMAAHNAAIYGVADQIDFHFGDARKMSLDGDLLFLDPPWGDMDLAGVFSRRPCWIKAPPGFAVPDGFTPEAWFGEAEGDYRRVKFLILKAARQLEN